MITSPEVWNMSSVHLTIIPKFVLCDSNCSSISASSPSGVVAGLIRKSETVRIPQILSLKDIIIQQNIATMYDHWKGAPDITCRINKTETNSIKSSNRCTGNLDHISCWANQTSERSWFWHSWYWLRWSNIPNLKGNEHAFNFFSVVLLI